jgi:hypothetical protein
MIGLDPGPPPCWVGLEWVSEAYTRNPHWTPVRKPLDEWQFDPAKVAGQLRCVLDGETPPDLLLQ